MASAQSLFLNNYFEFTPQSSDAKDYERIWKEIKACFDFLLSRKQLERVSVSRLSDMMLMCNSLAHLYLFFVAILYRCFLGGSDKNISTVLSHTAESLPHIVVLIRSNQKICSCSVPCSKKKKKLKRNRHSRGKKLCIQSNSVRTCSLPTAVWVREDGSLTHLVPVATPTLGSRPGIV